jgi:pilus assembly protein Flp/PilA
MQCIQQFTGDRRGVTMIEYALIAALVAMVAFAILQTMGSSLSKLYGKVNSKVTAA